MHSLTLNILRVTVKHLLSYFEHCYPTLKRASFISNFNHIISKGHIPSQQMCKCTCAYIKNANIVVQVLQYCATLINNYMAKERGVYCLNEQFVSNITRDIIFLTRSSGHFGNKHLASDLPMCEKQRTFPCSEK